MIHIARACLQFEGQNPPPCAQDYHGGSYHGRNLYDRASDGDEDGCNVPHGGGGGGGDI